MNYSFEIVCASVFTVFCIISARFYSLLNRAYTYWDKKKVNGPIPRYVFGTWGGFSEKVPKIFAINQPKILIQIEGAFIWELANLVLDKYSIYFPNTNWFSGSEDYANVLKYGKVCGTYDGLTPNLLVTDPELIKEILDASPNKLQDIRFARESSVILKDSLLSLCAGEKPEVRTLTASLLSPKKLEKLIPKLESSAETLIKIISDKRQEDGLVNITSSVEEFIVEVIGLAIFGIELNADVEFKDEFIKNMDQILKVKSPQSIWSILPYLYENYFKETWICPEKVLQYVVNLTISGMTESSTEDSTEGKTFNLIDLMVEAANEEKKLVKKEKDEENPDLVLTDNTIISKCIASVLTMANATRTSVLLGIYALSDNEEVQEKLYKEVKKNEVTSYEEIQQLNYLDRVVKEIQRLYPFEFRLERVTTDRIKLGGVDLDKNIRVSVPLYALHHVEEYYPEPDKFDPDRFSQSASEKRNPYTYLSFGQAGFNGSDISLQLGVLTTKLILCRLIQKFKFSTPQKQSLLRLFQKGFTRVPQPEKIEIFAEIRI